MRRRKGPVCRGPLVNNGCGKRNRLATFVYPSALGATRFSRSEAADIAIRSLKGSIEVHLTSHLEGPVMRRQHKAIGNRLPGEAINVLGQQRRWVRARQAWGPFLTALLRSLVLGAA